MNQQEEAVCDHLLGFRDFNPEFRINELVYTFSDEEPEYYFNYCPDCGVKL